MTITELLTDLEAKAQQATPGPWHPHASELPREWIYSVIGPHGVAVVGRTMGGEADANYLAACSPGRILTLVAYVRKLEQVRGAAANHIHNIPMGQDYITLPVLDCEICQSLIALAAHLGAEEEKA